jgi:hypothetical protein
MRTQHLLVGNFVVKLFHDTEADPTDEPEKGPNAGPDNDGNGRVA